MDTSLTEKLLEVLKKESAIYEGILNLSKEKTDAIVAGEISELERITKLEQSIILKLAKLEREREGIVENLAAGLDMEAADITLTDIINAMPEAEAKKLKDYQDLFARLLEDLREANMLNSKLIQNSLDYIDFSINILAGTGAEGNYSSLGGTGEVLKNNFFDMKL
ncbi:MAG: flagellar protein FlgN [Acetivibrionales bacterium]